MEKHKNGSFTSSIGFVLACVGSAVGLGNIWMFPYRLGEYGGAAFLIPYLFFILLFGFVGLSAEFASGRKVGTGTLGVYAYCFKERKQEKLGKILGWIPLMGSLGIAIGYSIIIGWVLRYLGASVTNTVLKEDSAEFFAGVTASMKNVPWHMMIVAITVIILLVGAASQIERANKVLMPLFFILFAGLAVRVFFLEGSHEGYRFLFVPNWKALLNVNTWVMAMGQAFFSLSVTGSGMIVYGAYLSKEENVIGVARHTALFDTIAAVVAALVIIPACFAYGTDVGAGPGLLFVTLPAILQDVPMGQLFAIILYAAMIFAGVSSLQNMFEAVAESLLHKFPKLSRWTVLLLLCVLCLGFGIGMEAIPQWGTWMDWVSIYIIPIGATFGAISWFYVMKKDVLMDAVGTKSRFWYAVGRYLYVPAALILCLVALFMKVAF